jgi:hypothetical protein
MIPKEIMTNCDCLRKEFFCKIPKTCFLQGLSYVVEPIIYIRFLISFYDPDRYLFPQSSVDI